MFRTLVAVLLTTLSLSAFAAVDINKASRAELEALPGVGTALAGRTQDAVYLSVLPFFHVTGLSGSLNGPLYIGATIVILPRWDRDTAATCMQRYRVTVWQCITTMAVDFLANPRLSEYDLSSLSGIRGGGAAMPEAVALRLKQLTGLEGIYLEQLHSFSAPDRDPFARTISIAYSALIDIKQYQQQLTDDYQAAWFSMKEIPSLIFDHNQMVKMARQRLRYKAASHPVLFELLPQKFTLPVLQNLFEDVYETEFDKGNFSRKMLSTGLLLKQTDKDKTGSKKGAFYYKLDKKHYKKNFHQLLRIVPNAHELI